MKDAPRKSATRSVAQLITDTRSIFRNQLDKMMTPFKKTNPDFYSGYFASRVIIDRVSTHSAPKRPPVPVPPRP